jgi:hypothetical protein
MPNRLYTINDDPEEICNYFEMRCKDGWSVSSFCGRLVGGSKTYAYFLHNHGRFRSIADKYGKVTNPQRSPRPRRVVDMITQSRVIKIFNGPY